MNHGIRRRTLPAIIAGVLLALALVGSLYAAGESLSRSGPTSAGGLINGTGLRMRTMAGEPVAGTVSAGGLTLCSGAGCNLGPIGPSMLEWWMPLFPMPE